MRSMISKLRLTSLLVVFAFVAGLAATASATVHPLSGNGRFQIGDGLPIPGGFTAAPNGQLFPVVGAVVSQTGADPQKMIFAGGEMKAAQVPFVVPVAVNNTAVFQVLTSIGITYPLAASSFSAAGRTGAATVAFCPGSSVTPTGNPGCVSGKAGTGSIKGLMVYTATAAQFGGAMTGRVFGGANVALGGPGAGLTPAPCVGCKVNMALASPNSTGTGGIGNAFGGSGMSPGAAPSSGMLTVTVLANGIIVAATPTSLFLPGIPNAATSVGAPWTTGMLTISAPSALGVPELFTLTGSDARMSGVGSISLVSGGLSNRALSGPNANRGWLNLSIGSPLGALPSMSGPGIAALVGLMSLAGGYAMRQRRK